MFTAQFVILCVAALWIIFMVTITNTKSALQNIFMKVFPIALAFVVGLIAFKII